MAAMEMKNKIIRILIFIGICIAVISAVESRFNWLSSLCQFWGNGCRETEHISFLKIPVSIWGVVYYGALAAAFVLSREYLFFLIMGGLGFEMVLISMMIEMKLICFYCLLNIVVFFLLVFLSFEKERVWPALVLTFFVFMVSDHIISTRPAKHSVTINTAPPPGVIARVGNQEISSREIDVALSSQIFKLQQQIYELKKKRLDYIINNRLIEMDAKEKGLTPEVVTYNILSVGTDVTDDEVERYYQENKDNINMGSMSVDELKAKIRNFLKEKKTNDKIEEYTKPLRGKYTVVTYLNPPDLPFTSVSEGSSPAIGPADAKVTVVEYSDYECPSCRKTHEVTRQIKEKFKGKIRWVFKDFPLDRHREAKYMASAARCAGEQGRFWEFQDLMYAANNVDISVMKNDAQSLGLNVGAFSECLENGRSMAVVEKDRKEGKEAGVSSTPTFVINGRLRPGYITFDIFNSLIQEELDKNR